MDKVYRSAYMLDGIASLIINTTDMPLTWTNQKSTQPQKDTQPIIKPYSF